MLWADWVIVAIMAASTALAFFRGFVREAFSLAGWVAALVVARLYGGEMEVFLREYVQTPSLRQLLAFASLFVATLVVFAVLGYLFMSLVHAAGLNWSDRLLGGVFGLLRGLILVLAILIMVSPYTRKDPWWQHSALVPVFMKYEFLGRKLKQEVVQGALHAGETSR